MVTLSLNPARELARGYRAFDFRSVGECNIGGMRCDGNLEQKYQQRSLVGQAQARLLGLDMLACDIALEVSVADGRAVCSGAVCAFDPESHRIAERVLKELEPFTSDLAREHPGLRFVLKYSQTATITSVDR